MPAFTLRGAAAVPAERLATDERALKRAAAARQRRTAAFEKHWNGGDYPTALWAIIRGAGAPGHQVGGRSPWSIIEAHEAHVAGVLRSLYAYQWRETRRDAETVRGRHNARVLLAA